MKIVISIGGSLLTEKVRETVYELDMKKYLKNYTRYGNVIKKLYNKGHQLVVVCGGGSPARVFQSIAREFTSDRILLDNIGIVGTDVNAYLFVAALGDIAYQIVLKDPEDVERVFEKYKGEKVIVCSGFKPGCSTDFDTAMHAEKIGADLIVNATNVDGVYTDDPRKNPNAKKLPKLDYKQFREIISKVSQQPGDYGLFDLKAIDIIERCKIKTVIVDGNDPEEIIRAVEGTHNGTVIE